MILSSRTHVTTVFLLGACAGLLVSQAIFMMALHDTQLSASVSFQDKSRAQALISPALAVGPASFADERVAEQQNTMKKAVRIGASEQNTKEKQLPPPSVADERAAIERNTKEKNLPRVTGKHGATPKTLERITGTPIINMGMMKAGTTSIFGYFRCGLGKQHDKLLTHYDCNPDVNDRNKIRMACGKRMRMNIEAYHQAAFNKMDQFLLYAEIDGQERKGGMVIPQYYFLEQIHEQFPNATYILNLRDPKAWIKSVDKWKDLRQKFIDKPLEPDLPKGVGADDADLERFYLAQAQRVRDFVKDHPSHQLVEVQIDSPDAGQVMQDHFGITKDCWGVRNVNHDGSAQWDMNPVEASALKK